MKIAFLTPEYPHYKTGNSGGIGTSIKNLALGLIKQGCSVRILVYGQKEDAVFEDNGICVQQIQNVKRKGISWYLTRKKLQRILNTLYENQEIDIVEAPDWTGITSFMKLKIPLVIRFHGSDTYFCHLENRHQKLKNFWFEKLAVQKAKAFIAPTTFAGEVSRKLFGIKNKIIKTIHYGLELNKFENLNPGVYEKGLILYIGTIIRKKGVYELSEIFNLVRKQHPEAKLILIGEDSSDIATQSQSTWHLLQQQFQSEDLEKVSYLGKIPYHEVQSYIKKAQVCVFPTFAETLGMVTIESMAMQKPIVNSNFDWAKELIIDGESGFLVYPKNHIEYAAKINAILEDNLLAKQLGENARKRVENLFDIEKISRENLRFYETLIK
ncbi:glycosyltransferase family 4 protein [Flavobacterium sp. 123]|uniref:glycosyltransferase family 4 protein n=1 Tax=Flavobacterium sp. 123 TaxID=2135627 RepID=UPI000EB49B78|nr:glycosyltransferase family 4 protein [Flavobacterium sp. 123]RKT00022.1 glycosyltransferase involved in cell wall biosynthesis [Flavobacterium sp. 123]